MKYLFLTVIIFLNIGSKLSAYTPLVVDIDNPNFRKLTVALPKFFVDGSGKELKDLAKKGPEELSRLLVFSGLFNVMSDSAYSDLIVKMEKKSKGKQIKLLGDDLGKTGIDIQQWKALSVESLTYAKISKESGEYTLEIRTIDLNRNKLILGKKYTKVKFSEFQLVMRRYADLLLEAYTGKSGIFNSKLVFVGKRKSKGFKQIFISDFDGSNMIQVTNDKSPHLSPAWSDDGRFISFTSYRDGNPDLYVYELATAKIRKLASYKGLNSGGNWSPGDQLIAFTGSVAGNAEIYYISPKGGKRVALIKGRGLDVDPAFSPNKKWMAYVSGRFGNPHIFLASLNWKSDTSVSVTKDQRLTYAGWYNATPAWSPNSDKIAFAGYDRETDRFDLFMMNPDGKKLERLTLRTGDNESPSWSPNGQMLVFHSSRVGKSNKKGSPHLYIMNRDGSAQRRLHVGLREAQTPKWSKPLLSD